MTETFILVLDENYESHVLGAADSRENAVKMVKNYAEKHELSIVDEGENDFKLEREFSDWTRMSWISFEKRILNELP